MKLLRCMIRLIIWLTLRKLSDTLATEILETKFLKSSICHVENRLKFGYMWQPFTNGLKPRLFQCLFECSRDSNCLGASLDEDNACFLHALAPPELKCSTTAEVNEIHRYWEKYCVQGNWNSESISCSCLYASSGERCDVYPPTCRYLIAEGYGWGKYYNITVDPEQNGKHPFKTECYIASSLTYVDHKMLINDGNYSYNFNRTWFEYVNGFYNEQRSFWAGLRAFDALRRSGECKDTFINVEYASHDNIYRRYIDFDLSKDNEYSYTYSYQYAGPSRSNPGGTNVGNCFGLSSGVSFSAWDKDNDNDEENNCAAQVGAGGWFNGCSNVCNFFGVGLQDSWEVTPVDQRVFVDGIDMETAHEYITNVNLHVEC